MKAQKKATLLTVGMILLWIAIQLSPSTLYAQDNTSSTATATRRPSITPDSTQLFRPTVRSTGLPPISSPTATATKSATPTATYTPTRTPSPTRTATSTTTATASATSTATSSATATPSLTASGTTTATATASASSTATATASATPSPSVSATVTPSLTATPSHTFTASATATATITPSPTATLTASHTSTPTPTGTRVPAVIQSTRTNEKPADGDEDGIAPGLLALGIVVTLLVGGYIVVYAVSAAAVERYAEGFFIHQCPVCFDGNLTMEERGYRVMGIPRVRRAVRCDNCRSVLREVNKRRWRYAVDAAANRELYDALNNKILGEQTLRDLAPDQNGDMPQYV